MTVTGTAQLDTVGACDISVIITAHRQGRLIHASLKSARRAIEHAGQRGIAAELVVVLHGSDDDTRGYFTSPRGVRCDRIESLDGPDPAVAKNHGVSVARGRHVSFLDGGDLCCGDWLWRAHQLLVSLGESRVVLHAEFLLGFGAKDFVRLPVDSDDPSFSPLDLLSSRVFFPGSFASRDLHLQLPFVAGDPAHGIGEAEWQWTCETLLCDISHKHVGGTVYFHRAPGTRREDAGTVGPTGLFDGESQRLWRLPPGPPGETLPPGSAPVPPVSTVSPGSRIAARGYALCKRAAEVALAHRSPRLHRWLNVVGGATHELVMQRESSRSPSPPSTPGPPPPSEAARILSAFSAEMRAIHLIEPEIFPAHDLPARLMVIPPTTGAPAGRCWPELLRTAGEGPIDHLFLLPWLRHGGGDLFATRLIQALMELHPAARAVVVLTDTDDPSPAFPLPAAVRVVSLPWVAAALDPDERLALLLRFAVQRKPRVIWNINSSPGYQLYLRFGPTLRLRSQLWGNVFGPGIDREGRRGGVGFGPLPRCFDHLSGVITDNRRVVDELVDVYALDPARFHLLPTPVLLAEGRGPRVGTGPFLEVLWASRMDWVKRPDVLLRIIQAARDLPVRFHVYGQPVVKDYDLAPFYRALRPLSHVLFYGGYDGFAALPIEHFDVFLYTTHSDGIPQVVLEAGKCGLPVIAPEIGGIGEVLEPGNSYLLSGTEAVEEYVDALRQALRDPDERRRKGERLRERIGTRYTWSAFKARVARLQGQIPEGGG